MSARRPSVRVPSPRFSCPTTPVPPQAALNVVTPVPRSRSQLITGAQLFEWQLGVLMDITAQSNEFVFVCAYRLQGVLNSHAMNSQSGKIRLMIISVVPCHRRFRA